MTGVQTCALPICKLPTVGAGLLREHRLYQADWLIRFYGFNVNEICEENENLSSEYDPKCAWALKNMHLFPIEINTAPLEMLLRVPGIGAKSAYKIIEARKFSKIGFENLLKMRIVLKRAKHFVTCGGKFYGADSFAQVKYSLLIDGKNEVTQQISMFSTPAAALSALTGEI